LFNLSSSRQFKGSHKAGIYCRSDCGPVFKADGSNWELGAYGPFNGDDKCISRANLPGFGIGVDADGNNLLTNKKDNFFTITEIEVWEVTYIVINILTYSYIGQLTEKKDREDSTATTMIVLIIFKKLHSLSLLLLL
jgi:hypothetical protein